MSGVPVVHTCFRCGSADAAWGFGVDVPKGSAGLWACRAHKAEAEEAVRAEQLARVARARAAMVPAQGSLL